MVIDPRYEGIKVEPRVRVFDGRDGRVRWSCETAGMYGRKDTKLTLALVDFGGDGKRSVCVSFYERNSGVRRTLVLDADGKERARREVKRDVHGVLMAADLNGDGRDELLAWSDGRIRALDRDLKEIWSRPSDRTVIDGILPGSSGRPCEVLLWPALALDGDDRHAAVDGPDASDGFDA